MSQLCAGETLTGFGNSFETEPLKDFGNLFKAALEALGVIIKFPVFPTVFAASSLLAEAQ